METERGAGPKVLVSYPGPHRDDRCQDYFVYLRPESNGVLVESAMLGVIQRNPVYKEGCGLVYLANLPGEFIQRHRVIESHYSLKLFFTKNGKTAFTPRMRSEFEKHFRVPFETADIVGAFEAMQRLGVDEEELFGLWVPNDDVLFIHGQCVKRKGSLFIVNYDIPALLHKNKTGTDIAAMILRVAMEKVDFRRMLEDIQKSLLARGILQPGTPIGRVFHHSKGPFEQILDARGYLYDADGGHISLKRISFCAYLLERGLSMYRILNAVKRPLFLFRAVSGELEERNLITATYGMTYREAWEFFLTAAAAVTPGAVDPPSI
jgi:hypothetical protein